MNTPDLLFLLGVLALGATIVALHTAGLSNTLRKMAAMCYAAAEAVDAAKAKYHESYSIAVSSMEGR